MRSRDFVAAYSSSAPPHHFQGLVDLPPMLTSLHDLLVGFGQRLHRRLSTGEHMPLAQFQRFSTHFVDETIAFAPVQREFHRATLASIHDQSIDAPLSRDERLIYETLHTDAHRRAVADETHRVNLDKTDQELATLRRAMLGGVWQLQMFGHTQASYYTALAGLPFERHAGLAAQRGIANLAAQIIAARDQHYTRNHTFFNPLNAGFRQAITGQLAEADALLLLLDISRRHPDIITLPAPPQFETYADEANADFLVLDTTNDQIIGVQVKASNAHLHYDHYDSDRIVFIDGATDMFDVLPRRLHYDSAKETVVSWPGQITGHFIHTTPPPRPNEGTSLAETTIAKASTSTIAREARNRNPEAAAIIRSRILTALGR